MRWSSQTLIGATLGSTLGGAAGIYAFGELIGHSGSYWAAAGGWAVGLAATAGVHALVGAESSTVTYVALFLLAAFGGALGYYLSLDDGYDGPAPTGALLELDGGGHLGVPDVNLGLGRDGGIERVDVKLIGGSW